jgi:hypothetical protein
MAAEVFAFEPGVHSQSSNQVVGAIFGSRVTSNDGARKSQSTLLRLGDRTKDLL